mmetsp:Transcript_604/g.1902  ORF Transcript_604/g.1902 Transcript_604/m.1902 type:complete len:203 (-) Transcript_604:45-653(-)
MDDLGDNDAADDEFLVVTRTVVVPSPRVPALAPSPSSAPPSLPQLLFPGTIAATAHAALAHAHTFATSANVTSLITPLARGSSLRKLNTLAGASDAAPPNAPARAPNACMASKAFEAHAHVMANAHNANAMTAATTRGCHERVITVDVAMIGGARATIQRRGSREIGVAWMCYGVRRAIDRRGRRDESRGDVCVCVCVCVCA